MIATQLEGHFLQIFIPSNLRYQEPTKLNQKLKQGFCSKPHLPFAPAFIFWEIAETT